MRQRHEAFRRGGHRLRRGDMKSALLIALEDGPGHGYEVIQRLEERTGGTWRPSPGSVYPTFQMLEDEGLVRSREEDGKRIYELTDEGREAAHERAQRPGGLPWERDGHDDENLGALWRAVAD